MTKRKNHSPDFKASVTLEAIREEMTIGGAVKEVWRASNADWHLEASGDYKYGYWNFPGVAVIRDALMKLKSTNCIRRLANWLWNGIMIRAFGGNADCYR